MELPLTSEASRATADTELDDLAPLAGDGAAASASKRDAENSWEAAIQRTALDAAASVVFWYVFLWHINTWPDKYFYPFLGAVALAMLLWRLRVLALHHPSHELQANLPYTCGVVDTGNEQVVLVATLHISPRAPRDVESVIQDVDPDVVMIELDSERLDRMRDDEVTVEAPPAVAAPADLQLVKVTERGGQPAEVLAQRAYWNAEWEGKLLSGAVVFDESDPYGLHSNPGSQAGQLRLVYDGSGSAPEGGGDWAPLALKAHHAAKSGAQALLVISPSATLPNHRIGMSTLANDLRCATRSLNFGFPPLPVLLLPQLDGERLKELLRREGTGAAQAEFRVKADNYPRRTLRRRLCQGLALVVSGIGILYGIIEMFAVEVGGEFLAAERTAIAKGIQCLCIDVDLDNFWGRLATTLLPTPYNVGQAILSWLAFPRVMCAVLFPPRGHVDVVGSMVLHLCSLPLKTWVAFLLAGLVAGWVTSTILDFFSYGAAEGAEATGVVKAKTEKDKSNLQSWILFFVEMYMYPCVYEAVAASRDEVMYQSIVSKGRACAASTIVVVAGAGHANGILARVRSRGI